MNEKMYCFMCDEMVYPTVKKVKNHYVLHQIGFDVENDVYLCPICNTEVAGKYVDKSLSQIYEEYLRNFDLSFSSFKEIRESYNLSQDMFAKTLGWGKKTVTRYENKQSLPQVEYLNVYRKLKSDKNSILHFLNQNKEMLGEDYYLISEKLNVDISMKSVHTLLYLLHNNPLYETQIMKYLFASDFESCKILGSPLTNLKYVHAPYGPIVDKRGELLKVISRYASMIPSDDDKICFVSDFKFDLKFFTKEEIAILDKIKVKFKGQSSKKLSDWSHQFVGWQKTKNGEEIGYHYLEDFNL